MPSNKNVVVLLLDTLRASAMSDANMPNIKRLARHCTFYNNAVSPGTWTAPSHAALFTDRKVSDIKGVSQDFFSNGTDKIDPWMVKTKFLDQNSTTIASKLSRLGYQTSLFSNNPFLTSFTNLGVGFDNIYDIWLESNVKYNKRLVDKLSPIINGGASVRKKMFRASYLMTRILPKPLLDALYRDLRARLNRGVSNADGTYRLDRGAKQTNKMLLEHLTYRHNYMKQFIFINYIEANENYPASRSIIQDKWLYMSGIEEMSEHAMSELYRGYLQRLSYLDREVGHTIEILKSKGILDDATLVITSDHGQMFGEHGMLYHSLPPYEGVCKVPIIAANFKNGKLVKLNDTISKPASLSALHKAIYDIADGREEILDGNMRQSRFVLSEHTGISEGWDEGLLKMLKSRSKSAQLIYDAKLKSNAKASAIYDNNIKLIHYFGKRKDEMYDVALDPEESSNILDSRRPQAHRMLQALRKLS